MLSKLKTVPGASAMLPYVRLFYDEPSEYQWADGAGRGHTLRQAEGGEHDDSLMPMLYALGQCGGLEEVQQRLPGSDALVVFSDDAYL